MLFIPCPYCGERPETEFHYGGEAHRDRPADPDALSDEAWTNYLFYRKNPIGVHVERWRHTHGCGRFFNLVRDTHTDLIIASYVVGAEPPAAARDALR